VGKRENECASSIHPKGTTATATETQDGREYWSIKKIKEIYKIQSIKEQ
jgi:hypothetical protein